MQENESDREKGDKKIRCPFIIYLLLSRDITLERFFEQYKFQILFLCKRYVCGHSRGHQRDQCIIIRYVEEISYRFGIRFFIACNPAGADTIRLQRNDQVLCRRTAVFKVLLRFFLTKDCKAGHRFSNELPVIGKVGDLFQYSLVLDNAEHPWLEVHGCGGMPGALDRVCDKLIINRFGFEFPDAVPGLDYRGYDIHSEGFAPPS